LLLSAEEQGPEVDQGDPKGQSPSRPGPAVRIPFAPPASPPHGCLSLLQTQMPLVISDCFMQMAERGYGMPPRRSASAAPPRWHVEFSGSDRRNSTCDVYNVRSSYLAGARESRSAMPPKCSGKPHCTMSVFGLLVFCLIGHPGRMPGSGRRRNVTPAACLLSGQEAAARWLDDHPKWELDKVRCSLGNRRCHSGEI
jgi:hypothetical protein